MRTRENTETNEMDTFIPRAGNNLIRCETDALVHYFHASVAAPHRNLFGSVRVSVEPWFTNQHFERASKGLCGLSYALAQGLQILGNLAIRFSGNNRTTNSRWCAELAKHRA